MRNVKIGKLAKGLINLCQCFCRNELEELRSDLNALLSSQTSNNEMIADLQSSVEEENRKRKNAESSLEAARDEVIFWPKFEDSF